MVIQGLTNKALSLLDAEAAAVGSEHLSHRILVRAAVLAYEAYGSLAGLPDLEQGVLTVHARSLASFAKVVVSVDATLVSNANDVFSAAAVANDAQVDHRPLAVSSSPRERLGLYNSFVEEGLGLSCDDLSHYLRVAVDDVVEFLSAKEVANVLPESRQFRHFVVGLFRENLVTTFLEELREGGLEELSRVLSNRILRGLFLRLSGCSLLLFFRLGRFSGVQLLQLSVDEGLRVRLVVADG